MKDKAILLLVGVGFACLAWALWHFLGNDGLGAITTLALVAVAVDNIRLRRQLHSTARKDEGAAGR